MNPLNTDTAIFEYFDQLENNKDYPAYWEWNGIGNIDGQLYLSRTLYQDVPGKMRRLIMIVHFLIGDENDEADLINNWAILPGNHYLNPDSEQAKAYYRVNRLEHNTAGKMVPRTELATLLELGDFRS